MNKSPADRPATRIEWEQSLGLDGYSVNTLLMAAVRKLPKLRSLCPKAGWDLDRFEVEP